MPQHNALIIGAGLYPLPLVCNLDDASHKYPWILEEYSWEYLEVAAMLIRLGKQWTMTVLDRSPEVCSSIKRQRRLAIANCYAEISDEYLNQFLATFGITKSDEAAMRAVNAELESKGIANRFTLIATMDIPDEVLKRTTVINGRAERLNELRLPHRQYDVITMLNTFRHLTLQGKWNAEEALKARCGNAGIILTDHEIGSMDELIPCVTIRSGHHDDDPYTAYFFGQANRALTTVS